MASNKKVARSVPDVILGEAAYQTTPEGRLRDMLAIASVIMNRARRLQVTPEEVVSAVRGSNKQFDAYNKELPAGSERYRKLAELALRDIRTAGPVTGATYYARPANLPQLLDGNPQFQRVGRTAAHVYFEDPLRKGIVTASGTIRPAPEPPFTPRRQTPFYDQGQFKASPRGVEYSLMGQEPLAQRISAAASAAQPDASRLTDQTNFWSNPSWQSYLFDLAQPGASQLPDSSPMGDQLPDRAMIPQPRPDPIDTRSIRGQRAGASTMPARGAPDSVGQYARLIRSLLGGLASARPFGAPLNGGGFDTVAVTRMIRQMQQAGASPDEIRQMIAENRRRAAGAR